MPSICIFCALAVQKFDEIFVFYFEEILFLHETFLCFLAKVRQSRTLQYLTLENF